MWRDKPGDETAANQTVFISLDDAESLKKDDFNKMPSPDVAKRKTEEGCAIGPIR